MNIAIIGAGWYGLHIASKLTEGGHLITIFEKSDRIFSGASGNNHPSFGV